MIAATVLLYYYLGGQGAAHKQVLMLAVIYGVAALMVSEFRYFSFKEFHLHRRHPFPVLLGLIVVAMLTIGAPEPMLFLGITAYVFSAPATFVWLAMTGRKPAPAQAQTAPASGEMPSIVLDKPGARG
jgi:CDP-diacylglycerol--serine O-phosphatidyltransferase